MWHLAEGEGEVGHGNDQSHFWSRLCGSNAVDDEFRLDVVGGNAGDLTPEWLHGKCDSLVGRLDGGSRCGGTGARSEVVVLGAAA